MKNQIKNENIEFINQKKLVNDSSLSFETHQILLGSLLGDMYLRKECKNPNIEETHSINQKDYLKWKYKILSNYFDLKLYNFNNPICKAKGKIYIRKTEVRLRSKVSEKLNLYHNLFYKNDKKTITQDTLNQLDTLGLAVWYCDDGHYDLENRTVELHTEGFSIEENQLLKNWFNKRWNITVNFKKDPSKNKVLLRFPIKETDKFLNLTKKHIFKMPQSMWYKLGHFWEGNIGLINKKRLNKIQRMKKYESRPEIKIRKKQRSREYYYKNKEQFFQRSSKYRKTQKYKDYINEYTKRPKVIKRRREREKLYRKNPEYKMKRALYQKEYRKRPEVKIKIKKYNKKAKEKQRGGQN